MVYRAAAVDCCVPTLQATAPANERNDLGILKRRLEANVLLIQAVGDGWDVSGSPEL
jgi:hypothetical protein